MTRLTWVAAALAVCGMASGGRRAEVSEPTAGAAVQTLFAARCVECHGPEAQKSGLRLDTAADVTLGGDSGAVVVPGDGDASRLYQLVAGLDPETHMPPKGEPLTEAETSVVKQWIDEGAVWPADDRDSEPTRVESDHWSFQPIQRHAAPAVANRDWVRNRIDQFVLAKLEAEGIAPSPEADRPTLIRRLNLDLIGLPPTPQEVDDFVNDTSPYAYERVVSRLLASPHFGERWGRHWLDLARYADSDGFEKDTVRPHAWRYRQWLIEALNRDLPFDQFVIEQLAGDLLPHATLDQQVATGFHRNTLTNKEGGVDQEQFRVEQVVDRVNTTASVFTGLTLACAQCHSHKYDPFTQREYYGMFAFFNSADEKDIPAPLGSEQTLLTRELERFEVRRRELAQAVAAERANLPERLAAWERQMEPPPGGEIWTPLVPTEASAKDGVILSILDDGSILASGKNPRVATYTVAAGSNLQGVTGFLLEPLADESFPGQGPGRGEKGEFILSEFIVERVKGDGSRVKIPLTAAWSQSNASSKPIEQTIDGAGKTGWTVTAAKAKDGPVSAVFVTKAAVESNELALTLSHQGGDSRSLGRFRLYATTAPRDALAIPPAVREALTVPLKERSEEQQREALAYYETLDPTMRELQAALKAHEATKPDLEDTLAQVLVEREEPRETHVHIRGDFMRKGEPVEAHTPAVLPPLTACGESPDRLDLARWLVSPEHPLTARVAANRLWEHLFGQGLVETSEDFGTRGEKPSHPELLDWLATEYMACGWSTKEMIRFIVGSATYRQSSAVRPDLLERDPSNKLLARQNRFRVEAEIVRDLFLASSGLLNPVVGGPSVRPPLPPGVAELGYANSVKWPESEGDNKYRRGIYIHFQRTVPYPMLMTFDCPDSNVTAVRRARSNTPLQALLLLNSPVFFECAQAFGQRIAEEAPANAEGGIREVFRLCLAREPEAREMERLLQLWEADRAAFLQDIETAKGVVGDYLPEGADAEKVAPWVTLSRAVMNLDEFVTRE